MVESLRLLRNQVIRLLLVLRLLKDRLLELRHPRALHSQFDLHAQTPGFHQLHGFLEERRIGVQALQVVIFSTLEVEL